jgi:CheY-like chemotaxis protein
LKILVVEDDKKVASFLEKGLREEGYSVDVAHNGEDGLLKAHVHDYDLLLLDVMLPEKSGLEIVRDLRSRESSVPVLLLTAWKASKKVAGSGLLVRVSPEGSQTSGHRGSGTPTSTSGNRMRDTFSRATDSSTRCLGTAYTKPWNSSVA